MPTPRRIAFVRAVMIGREGLHRDVLLDLFRQSGAIDPRNHLTTGNVSFNARAADIGPIVGQVEAGIQRVVGRPTPVFVRALDHLVGLVERDPFRAAPFAAEQREVVILPPRAPEPTLPIESPSGGLSVFATNGTELFAVSRGVDGRAPEAAGGLVQRVLGIGVTVRAWSTIEKIVAAHR
jgi:uncharacterized protein (DUF1697 family)